MISGKPKKAPKVTILPKKKPMFMRENDAKTRGKSPQSPLTGKKLSK